MQSNIICLILSAAQTHIFCWFHLRFSCWNFAASTFFIGFYFKNYKYLYTGYFFFFNINIFIILLIRLNVFVYRLNNIYILLLKIIESFFSLLKNKKKYLWMTIWSIIKLIFTIRILIKKEALWLIFFFFVHIWNARMQL